MPDLDVTGWPIWLVALLLVLNLFREQLGSFVPQALRDHFQARARRQALELETKVEQERDSREFLQRSETEALHSLLSLNERLTNHLMDTSNSRLTELERMLNVINHKQSRLEDLLRLVVRDWSRWPEILDDIDQVMKEVKDALKKISA